MSSGNHVVATIAADWFAKIALRNGDFEVVATRATRAGIGRMMAVWRYHGRIVTPSLSGAALHARRALARRHGAGARIDRDQRGKPHRLFEQRRRLQQRGLATVPADHLQADRAAVLIEAAWHRNGR